MVPLLCFPYYYAKEATLQKNKNRRRRRPTKKTMTNGAEQCSATCGFPHPKKKERLFRKFESVAFLFQVLYAKLRGARIKKIDFKKERGLDFFCRECPTFLPNSQSFVRNFTRGRPKKGSMISLKRGPKEQDFQLAVFVCFSLYGAFLPFP